MYLNFIKKYLFFSLVVAILTFIFNRLFVDPYLIPGIWGNYLVFFFLVLISSLILLRVLNKNSSNFQVYTLGAIFAKMIIAVIYFYFVFKHFNKDLLIFVGSFFVSYLLFTIFEVSFLVRFLRKKADN